MKAAPTLDGRLRIDPENDLDLAVMRAVVPDARSGTDGLVERVSGTMDESLSNDWEEFVQPELREQFDGQLMQVAEVLVNAEVGEPVFIDREQADTWYGTFNQARLSLEAKYALTRDDPDDFDDDRRAAWLRSQFYGVIQDLMLEFLMD